MILTVFLNFLFFTLNGLILLLPVQGLPSVFVTSLQYVFGIANQFSYVFPIYQLMAAFVVMMAFDLVVLLWHMLNWLLVKIPGASR